MRQRYMSNISNWHVKQRRILSDVLLVELRWQIDLSPQHCNSNSQWNTSNHLHVFLTGQLHERRKLPTNIDNDVIFNHARYDVCNEMRFDWKFYKICILCLSRNIRCPSVVSSSKYSFVGAALPTSFCRNAELSSSIRTVSTATATEAFWTQLIIQTSHKLIFSPTLKSD